MIVDLHCHYPMHVLAGEDTNATLAHMSRLRKRRWIDKPRAVIVAIAARLLNHRRWGSRWRVDLEGLQTGDVRVVLSVLYQPFAEIDLDEPYAAPPEDGYFDQLQFLMDEVVEELEQHDGDHNLHEFVSTAAQLDAVLASGRIAFIHCIEGGFHLGRSVEQLDDRVACLAQQGVAYITLAHLFYRQVATNAPALPFLPDWLYDRIFSQHTTSGLTALGEEAVRAMYRHRVLVDVSHMRQDALDRTFELLDELDDGPHATPDPFPVIASHVGYRMKPDGQAYNLSRDTVEKIAARRGVMGIILAQHQLNEGVHEGQTDGVTDSLDVICKHIDAIHEVVGSHECTAIGTDLDGFIKPTMTGFDRAADLWVLREGLRRRYPQDADAILHGNALRVLRAAMELRT